MCEKNSNILLRLEGSLILNYENKAKQKKEKVWIVLIAFFVVMIITCGINYDIINYEIRERKVKSIIKDDNYYIETSFEKAILEKINTNYVPGGRGHSGRTYNTSVTVKTLESNKKIRIQIIGENLTKYRMLLNKEIIVCKFIYHNKNNNKIAEEYRVVSPYAFEDPVLFNDFEHRGIRYICNYNFEDIIQLKTPIDVRLDFICESRENMSIYESSKDLKPTYESIYGNCYVFIRKNKWCLYLEHSEDYYILRRKRKMLWNIIRNDKRRFSW